MKVVILKKDVCAFEQYNSEEEKKINYVKVNDHNTKRLLRENYYYFYDSNMSKINVIVCIDLV